MNRRWLLPVATLALLVLGTAAVVVAITLAVTADDSPSGAPAAPTGSLTHGVPPAAGAPVVRPADPAWVSAAAASTGISEPALTAYVGAASAVARTHPGCGLGWNTLAAIGRTPAPPGTLGPMGIDPTAWTDHGTDGDGDGRRDPHDLDDAALSVAVHLCSLGGDVRQAAGWESAIAAHHADPAYVRTIGDTAARLATAAPTSAP